MNWPALLILFPSALLGFMLAERVERRREDLSALRLLAELLGLYLLVGVALAAVWIFFGGGDELPGLFILALIGLPAMSRWAEAQAVRTLARPLRWTVLGAVVVFPLLGFLGAAALLRPQLRDEVGETLLWTLGLAAALAVFAALWQGLERVWVLPAAERRTGAGRPDELPSPDR